MNIKKRHNILKYICMIIGVICVIYSLIGRTMKGSLSNYFMFIGTLFILLTLILRSFAKKHNSRKYKFFIGMIESILVLGMAIFVIVETLIIYSANIKNDVNVDYVIVLGAGLWGTEPSPILVERLDAALIYLKKYPDTKIVLSGGRGNGENITEAEAMKKYLIEHGINENSIIKEEKSVNTMQNFKFSKEIIKKYDNRENIKIEIVTNGFHMFRSKLLAKRNGFIAFGYSGETYPPLVPAYYCREALAVIKSLIMDR